MGRSRRGGGKEVSVWQLQECLLEPSLVISFFLFFSPSLNIAVSSCTPCAGERASASQQSGHEMRQGRGDLLRTQR